MRCSVSLPSVLSAVSSCNDRQAWRSADPRRSRSGGFNLVALIWLVFAKMDW